MPRFYLKRFADTDEKVAAVDLRTGRVLSGQGVDDVALQTNFYGSGAVESRLAKIDDTFARAFANLDTDGLPPRGERRHVLSAFVVVQLLRSRWFRDNMLDVIDVLVENLMANGIDLSGPASETAAGLVANTLSNFSPRGRQAPRRVKQAQLQAMGDALVEDEIVRRVAERDWAILATDGGTYFCASDQPVAWDFSRAAPFSILDSAWLLLPLDPSRALVMSKDGGADMHTVNVSRTLVQLVNTRTISGATRWVYFHAGEEGRHGSGGRSQDGAAPMLPQRSTSAPLRP